MPQKIIDSITATFSTQFINDIAKRLGEPANAIQKGIDLSIQIILIGLQKRTTSSEGANLIIKLAYEQHEFDVVAQKNSFHGTESVFWLSRARGLVRSLFGIKCEKIFKTVKEHAQISTDNTKSIVGIASSIVMCHLGEFAISNKLNSCDLSFLIEKILSKNNAFFLKDIDGEAIFATPVINTKPTQTFVNKQGVLQKTWKSIQQIVSIIF